MIYMIIIKNTLKVEEIKPERLMGNEIRSLNILN